RFPDSAFLTLLLKLSVDSRRNGDVHGLPLNEVLPVTSGARGFRIDATHQRRKRQYVQRTVWNDQHTVRSRGGFRRGLNQRVIQTSAAIDEIRYVRSAQLRPLDQTAELFDLLT